MRTMEMLGKRPLLRITAIIVTIALFDLLLLMFSGAADISRIAPRHPRSVLTTYGMMIAIGIAIQVGLRDKPGYKRAKLLAYAFTLAISLAAGLVIVNLILVGRR